jgi:mono/diheme cytochrome c family protein
MRTVVKLLLLPVLGVLCAGIVIAAGLVDFSAMKPPSHFEEELATFALNRSIKHHAPNRSNPLAGQPAAATAGLALFRTHCVACHGAPGVDPTEAGASLNPPAPGLTLPRIQKRPDGELFYIVSHGIKMTGMPSFAGARTDEEIWQLVVALRRLPTLTDEEKRALRAAQ